MATKTKDRAKMTTEELDELAEKEQQAAYEAEEKARQAEAEWVDKHREELDVVAAAIAGVERDAIVLPGDPLVGTFFAAAKAALWALEDLKAQGPKKREKALDGLDIVSDPAVPTGADVEGGTAQAVDPGSGRPTSETTKVAHEVVA